MNKILILYPKQFNCYEKFHRKVTKIIKNINEFSVVYPNDPNNLIGRLFEQEFPDIFLSVMPHFQNLNVTHAIIFDDGEEFPDDTLFLQNEKIPLRLIKINITRVINIKKDVEFSSEKSTLKYEYIGRGAYWGNPYSMYEEGDSRDEVIRKYKYDFDYEKFINKEKSEVYKLAGKRLGCFCKPQSCHGDVLADFLNSWDDGS
ncbi:hypothetical protein CXF72_14365 [Psychromonas sp. MB-3u-54]|uniref:DUF4326 domain-containing protein n=1 Tax=Psychromonas sp. MB-3u-54 TaxID=2058319 RepID=UPI000C321762|nr:DUF4326 domain-containing protein [Psychromonas sp. MB-3u-54]PKH01865.1 hypothetical protein CXF72_14365 [Psychromonas sp. MB-3u-54]